MNVIHHDHYGIWFCVPFTILRVFLLLSAFRKHVYCQVEYPAKCQEIDRFGTMSEVDRLRSVRPLIDPLSLLQARQRSLRHARNVMSDLGHHFGRISHSGLEIILQKLVCRRTIAFRRVESRFPIKARKKLCVFWILIGPDDFEPIQNYVCINVDLLQIDTEIKRVNNIEKHQTLINR
jgi:hypothetical protein